MSVSSSLINKTAFTTEVVSSYCTNNFLNINKAKSKVMVFSKRNVIYNGQINREPIEKVNSFTYLGVVFSHTGSWLNNFKRSTLKAEISTKQLYKLFNYSYPGTLLFICFTGCSLRNLELGKKNTKISHFCCISHFHVPGPYLKILVLKTCSC